MSKHIAILDVGKTNKKVLVFDQDYQLVFESQTQLPEINDEDGDPCESTTALLEWMDGSIQTIMAETAFDIQALNFTAYGASWVLLTDDYAHPFIYNYLKPMEEIIQEKFLLKYGPKEDLCIQTASPWMGSLNSGLQLYNLKYNKPELFKRLRHALHLPHFLSYHFTNKMISGMTSIGCHTLLWDFKNNHYHRWIASENLMNLFPELSYDLSFRVSLNNQSIALGTGLHDSSAALIPYLKLYTRPFVLLSSGTWNIAINPFAGNNLTIEELSQDCLFYLSYEGKPVKASRLFLGHEHEEQCHRIATYFNVPIHFYKSIVYEPSFAPVSYSAFMYQGEDGLLKTGFEKRVLSGYKNAFEAYHQLISDCVDLQIKSLNLICSDLRKADILVDGGFAQNEVFMSMLCNRIPDSVVYSAELAQASAIGAAMAIHDQWNTNSLNEGLIRLIRYQA